MGKQLDIFAVTNDIQVERLSSSGNTIYTGDVISYGLDNLYPNTVFDIIKASPTAGGCVKRKAEFVFGRGSDSDFPVNRHNKSINDILNLAAVSLCKYNGFALHFNYNLIGQITEIQHVDIRYLRRLKNLKEVMLGKIERSSRLVYVSEKKKVKLPLYIRNGMRQYLKGDGTKGSGGFKNFNGAIYYFNRGGGIYPECPFENALDSAQFENEAQIFSLMSVKNGFSGSGVLKIPDLPDDEEKKKEIEKQIARVVGTQNAGSVLVISAPMSVEGKMDSSKIFEPFQTQKVDDLHKIQSERAKDFVLRAFGMPEILLGVSNDGMFNQESFQDAFDYYNGDTEKDRMVLERAFNAFWDETVFTPELSEIEIQPLEMKKDNQSQKDSQDGNTNNT